MADDIDEIVGLMQKSAQSAAPPPPQGDDIDEILKFMPAPVGGTFGEREAPGPGAPTPAPPFPPYPGGYQKFNEPEQPGAGFGTMAQTSLVDDPLTKVKIFAEARGIPPAQIGIRYRFGKDGEIEFKTDSGRWQREISEAPLEQIKNMGASVLAHPSTYGGTAGALVAGAPGAVLGAMGGEATRKAIGRVVYDEPQTIAGNLFDVGLEGLLALGGEMVGKLVVSTTNRYLTRKAPRILKRAGAEIFGGELSPADHARALYLKQLGEKHGVNLLPHQLYDKASMTDMWVYLRKHPLTANAIQKFDDALESETNDAVKNFVNQMGGYAEEPYAIGTKLKGAATDAIEQAEGARAGTAKPYYDAAFDDTPIIDKNALQAEYKFNSDKIAKASAQTQDIPDTRQMVSELGKISSVPTMKIKGEPDAAYIARISKDYQRITGKDVPMVKSKAAVENLDALKQRNQEIESILSGAAPAEGARVPTIPRTVDITPAMDEIDRILTKEVTKGSPSYAAVAKIKKMLQNAGGNPRLIDNVKQDAIDEVLNKQKVKPAIRRRMAMIKEQLTMAMDEQIPDYAAARGIWGQWGMGKPIDDLKLSVIGRLKDMKMPEEIEDAVVKIFGRGGRVPSDVALKQARDVIMKQDPDLWRRAVGHYIREVYGEAQAAQSGEVINVAGKMHQKLFGSINKREAMAAAFGGENTAEYKSFKGLMEVLQRAAGGKGGQSITHFAGEIKENITPKMGSKMYQFLSSPKQYVVEQTFGWWNDMLLHGRQEDLLKALIDPQVQAKIAQIKPLKPGSRRYIEAFTTMTALVATKVEYQTPEQTAPGP